MVSQTQNYSDIKEKIISTTISLIEESDGMIDNITVRAIAQKADIAVGLINYHFGSKKNLIEICVQQIISHVMRTFSETEYLARYRCCDKKLPDVDIAVFTAGVFSFLLDHPQIAKISMLGDLSHPDIKSNSSVSFKAIYKAMSVQESESDRKIKAFILLSVIQSAFLNRQISAELLGFNLSDKDGYAQFFRLVTKMLSIT
jgi:AcrR family transcriptional regulator